MLIPNAPTPRALRSISPSLYEALLSCPARAAWYATGTRGAVAPHPSALLAISFHGVMEALQKGRITGTDEECRLGARSLFDGLAARIHTEAHPLIKVKFPSPQKLPYYNLLRERSAALAADYSRSGERQEAGRAVAEGRFESSDGVIVGRPDMVDVGRAVVVDYKTGQAAKDGWRVSEREARQLSLYVYLAAEAGITATRGMIVRGNGDTARIDISKDTANAEAERARKVLAEFNASIDGGSTFYGFARPSADACRMCPCIPLCERFWEAADPSWSDECGIHLEGTVTAARPASVQGTALLTVEVDASRGTIRKCEATIEQIPAAWVVADGDRAPEAGDTVRLVDARLVSEDPTVIRADRVTTSLWRVGGET